MDSSNKKTAGAVVIVLIVVLIFSWQYIGQEEKGSSPMEGEWTLASFKVFSIPGPDPTNASAMEAPAIDVSVDGDIVTVSDEEGAVKFCLVSDHHAVAIDYGYNDQLYLHGGMLYRASFMHGEVMGVLFHTLVIKAYSQDGAYDSLDGMFGFDGTMQSIVAEVYNGDNAVLGSEVVTFAVNEEALRGARLMVDVGGTAAEALGFVMGEPDAYTIFCMTVDGTAFNLTVEDGAIMTFTGAAGPFDAVQYYVYDRDGCLAVDIYGLGSDTVIHRTDGYEMPVNGYYEDGRLCEKRTDGSVSLFAVTAQCTDGCGYALVAGGSIVVNADGKLWLIDCDQIPVYA